jgi:ERCC4-type nuclease
MPHTDVIVLPFTIIIDTREKSPYAFSNIKADASEGGGIIVAKTKYDTLRTGDYSIVGHEDYITIERKSKEDAYQTFGTNRKRFERELQRMAEMKYAAVVIEDSWDGLLTRPPIHSKLNPKTVYRSIIAWSQRYGVHFFPCPGKRFAENLTLRMLQRWYKDNRDTGGYQGGVMNVEGVAGNNQENTQCT